MRHLFVIQCHESIQSIKLADLLTSISPKFEILMSCDVSNHKVISEVRSSKYNSVFYPQGYYTIEAALTHIFRLSDIQVNFDFDWIHVISASDLPFVGIFKIDEICEGKEVICQLDGDNPTESIHGSTWYSLSKKSVNFINLHRELILKSSLNFWATYNEMKLNGGFDEYLVSQMLGVAYHGVDDKLRGFSYLDGRRFIVFPHYENATIYGLPATNSSPVTFKMSKALMNQVDCDHYLFGRKFDLGTEAYQTVYNYIKNHKSWIN